MKMSLVFFDALVSIRIVVVVLETKLVVQLLLKSLKGPVWVIAPAKGSPDMWLFLYQ